MNGKHVLYVSQYGEIFHARSVRELQHLVGGGRVHKMLVDKKDGSTVHIGYVVGRLWLQAFRPIVNPA